MLRVLVLVKRVFGTFCCPSHSNFRDTYNYPVFGVNFENQRILDFGLGIRKVYKLFKRQQKLQMELVKMEGKCKRLAKFSVFQKYLRPIYIFFPLVCSFIHYCLILSVCLSFYLSFFLSFSLSASTSIYFVLYQTLALKNQSLCLPVCLSIFLYFNIFHIVPNFDKKI